MGVEVSQIMGNSAVCSTFYAANNKEDIDVLSLSHTVDQELRQQTKNDGHAGGHRDLIMRYPFPRVRKINFYDRFYS